MTARSLASNSPRGLAATAFCPSEHRCRHLARSKKPPAGRGRRRSSFVVEKGEPSARMCLSWPHLVPPPLNGGSDSRDYLPCAILRPNSSLQRLVVGTSTYMVRQLTFYTPFFSSFCRASPHMISSPFGRDRELALEAATPTIFQRKLVYGKSSASTHVLDLKSKL